MDSDLSHTKCVLLTTNHACISPGIMLLYRADLLLSHPKSQWLNTETLWLIHITVEHPGFVCMCVCEYVPSTGRRGEKCSGPFQFKTHPLSHLASRSVYKKVKIMLPSLR